MTDVKGIFRDTYLLYTKSAAMGNDEKEWSALMDEAQAIAEKYKSELCSKMTIAVLIQIEAEKMGKIK